MCVNRLLRMLVLTRYLRLLQDGAREFQLDAAYREWLDALLSVDSRQRGTQYWTSEDGRPLRAYPKIRTGSTDARTGGQRRGGRRGGPGRSGSNRQGRNNDA